MNLEVSVSPLASLPLPSGAHELAWSYLLDFVVADASMRGLGALHVSVPSAALVAPLELRASVSRNFGVKPNGAEAGTAVGREVGVALLGFERRLPAGATRLYSLEFGLLAPAALRRTRSETQGWQLERRLNVYSLPAYLWGGFIRVSAPLYSKALSDQAMFRMRRAFTLERSLAAFYHLAIWTRVC